MGHIASRICVWKWLSWHPGREVVSVVSCAGDIEEEEVCHVFVIPTS